MLKEGKELTILFPSLSLPRIFSPRSATFSSFTYAMEEEDLWREKVQNDSNFCLKYLKMGGGFAVLFPFPI